MGGGKKNVKEASYLPEEILFHHIFVKLDIEDVTPCKFVCKAWNRVIRDPEFAALHFKSNRHHYSTKLLMKDEHDVFYSADYDQAIAYKTSLLNAHRLNSRATTFPGNAVFLGSKNGMVLVQISTKLLLWNPTTRESKLIRDPNPPIGSSHQLGLAYDVTIDDYKIVRISICVKPRDTFLVDVYSLKEDLWKIGKKSDAVRTWYAPLDDTNRHPVEVNGVMYWLVSSCDIVLGFSLSEEKFVILKMPPDVGPPCYSKGEPCWGLTALGKSELAAYMFWEEYGVFYVFTMKGPDKNPTPEWNEFTRLRVVEYEDGKLTKLIKPLLSYHGKLLLIITYKSSDKRRYQKLVVYNPTRNIILDRELRRHIYDPNEKVFEEDISINGIESISDVIYTQSLVSPNDFGRTTPPGEQG